jgi:hypothetical protein
MSDGCHDDSLLAKNFLSATHIRGADRVIGSKMCGAWPPLICIQGTEISGTQNMILGSTKTTFESSASNCRRLARFSESESRFR